MLIMLLLLCCLIFGYHGYHIIIWLPHAIPFSLSAVQGRPALTRICGWPTVVSTVETTKGLAL